MIKYSVLVSNVDSGEGYTCVYGKSTYLPLSFIVNLKLLKKNKRLKNVVFIDIKKYYSATKSNKL